MCIVGIDEVGRGCLAGPVVASSVVLPKDFYDERIKDSKKIPAKQRCILSDLIAKKALSIGIGVVCSIIIDKVNILNATKQAMQISLSKISVPYDKVIVDAVYLKNIEKKLENPNKADENYIEVSAASIIAKVYRDNLMKNLSKIYPEYLWDKNAGYGTKAHIDNILKYGYTSIHRLSFLSKWKGKIRLR